MAINIKRNAARQQAPETRVHNFDEVSLGFDYDTAILEAQRCLNCKNPKCVSGCPVNVKIPNFISKIVSGEMDKAYDVITQDSNLPAVCGRVCPQEMQCEKLCVKNNEKLGGAVAIGTLERFVADYAIAHSSVKERKIMPNGKKVAVIGSGPAGLTCAADLALGGCKVTVYEAFHKAGGVLVYGIPEFRLPKALVAQEIEGLKKLGVEIKLNCVIGKTFTIEDLQQNYDAIFIGTGAGLPMFLGIEGEALNGVFSANEFLTRVNLMEGYKSGAITPVRVGNRIVVVGAGNVAMDVARTAKRLGAEEVIIVYRRTRNEIPARHEEVEHAEEEGIKFMMLTAPVKINGETEVKSITCIKMELGEPDASGRRSPIKIEGSEFDFECDQVIVALGTSPNPLIHRSCKELNVTKKGTLIVNEDTNQTNVNGIYAGGDAVTGAATVILAMGAGKKAAKAILDSFQKQ